MKTSKFFLFFLCLIVLSVPVFSQSDIAKNDPAYPAIKRVLDEGYLSLYGTEFRGKDPVNRQEMAILVHRLLKTMDRNGQSLSKSELNDLSKLSKTFKDYLANYGTDVRQSLDALNTLKNEQVALNHDLSRTQADLEATIAELKEENKQEHKHLLYGIIGAAILGLLGG